MKGFISDKGWLTRAAVATAFGCMAIAVAPAQTAAQLLANVGHVSVGCTTKPLCGISQISVAQLQPGWAVTAFKDQSNNLELIAWQWTTGPCPGKGSLKLTCDVLERRGSQTGDSIDSQYAGVAIARVNANRVITAIVNQSTTPPFGLQLVLTTWSVNTSPGPDIGTIAQENQIVSTGPPPNYISMTGLNGSQVVTAILVGCPPVPASCTSTSPPSSTLYLAAWAVSSTGTITAQGTAPSTTVTVPNPPAITNTNSSGQNQVVTAYAAVDAGTPPKGTHLTLSSWNVSADGTITLQQNASAGSAGGVSLTSWGVTPSENVAAAFVNGSNQIEVINWTVDPSTGVFTRQASGTSGAEGLCFNVYCYVSATTFANRIFTAVDSLTSDPHAQASDLNVMEWENSASKLYVIAQGDSGAHNALIAAAPLDDSHTVTASLTENLSSLEMYVWSYGVK